MDYVATRDRPVLPEGSGQRVQEGQPVHRDREELLVRQVARVRLVLRERRERRVFRDLPVPAGRLDLWVREWDLPVQEVQPLRFLALRVPEDLAALLVRRVALALRVREGWRVQLAQQVRRVLSVQPVQRVQPVVLGISHVTQSTRIAHRPSTRQML